MGLLKRVEQKSGTRERALPSGERIETDIDRLYQLVLERSPLRLSEAASVLGRGKDLIQDWAKVLENANLIKIHYPAVGEPELVRA